MAAERRRERQELEGCYVEESACSGGGPLRC